MSRLSVLSGFTRSVLRSTKRPMYILRHLADNSDTTFSLDETQNNLKKFEKAEPVEHTSHLFVWPNVREKNHHYEERKQEAYDDITASWGWKNNELDVEQLAGMPGPTEVEDPYLKLEEKPEEDKLFYSEDDHSGIQEDLQFERMRSRREQLNQDSQESFASFERNSLTCVRENVDFMMQELGQISLLLSTLYPEESTLVGTVTGQSENTMDKVSSDPEMASLALNQSEAKKLDHEKVSNQPLDVAKNLDQEDKSNSEFTTSMSDQSGLEEIDTSVIAKESEDTPLLQILSAGDSREPSPSKTTESPPKTTDRQDMQPKEHIHTYRPFRTIEVPVNEPTKSPSSETSEEQPFSQESLTITNHLDNTGYTVSAQLSEPESRLLMRMALKQALEDLESGKSKYKATILEAETE
ncbi:uncharacterized protein spaw [Drosophila takahashii]|uniref:uncharacterized protein spaw n=1 Tax=Drosophila takahashii TaxID=29030 RepID=UPI001CF8CF9A|nr:uncharacterized protein LOC108062545 [Drosophila takahashii]